MKLTLIENQLVPIYKNNKQEECVNARELHEFLGIATRFNDWIKDRIAECDLQKKQDYITFTEFSVETSRNRTEYILTLDSAKHFAMMERNSKGKEIRQYFIDFEKRIRESARQNLSLITRYVLPEFRAYEPEFPEEYYKEIYRLRGWPWGHWGNHHPDCVGTYTQKWVYDLLPDGIAEALKMRNERDENGNLRYKNHQFLSEDGLEHLRRHFVVLLGLMGCADTWEEFEDRATKAFNRDKSITQLRLLMVPKRSRVKSKQMKLLGAY